MIQGLVLTDRKITYFFCIAICISLLDTLIPGIRYIKYAIPGIAILLIAGQLGTFSLKGKNNFLLLFVLYAIWGLFSALFINLSLTPLGINDALFVLSYALPLYLFGNGKVDLYKVFFLYSVFFLLSTLGMEMKGFSIALSEAPFESGACFAFGAFFLYFCFEKKLWYAVFSLILIVLTLKRIAFLAIVICIVLYLFPRITSRLFLSKYSYVIFSSLWIVIVFTLVTGLFDYLILDLTGINVHHFTMGRFSLYFGVVEESIVNPFSLILGNGIGDAYALALRHFEAEGNVNLHSDTLKIFYENGAIFFTLFFLSFGFVRNFNSRILLFYICFVFFTDNILIYQSVMFFVLLIVLQIEMRSHKEKAL